VGIVFPHTIFPWDIAKEKWGGGKKSPLVGLAKIMRWGGYLFPAFMEQSKPLPDCKV